MYARTWDSTWNWSSESMLRSHARRPNHLRHVMLLSSRSRLVRREHKGDSLGEAPPARLLLLELASSGSRQPVVLRVAAFLGCAPLGAEPTLVFEPVESRVE